MVALRHPTRSSPLRCTLLLSLMVLRTHRLWEVSRKSEEHADRQFPKASPTQSCNNNHHKPSQTTLPATTPRSCHQLNIPIGQRPSTATRPTRMTPMKFHSPSTRSSKCRMLAEGGGKRAKRAARRVLRPATTSSCYEQRSMYGFPGIPVRRFAIYRPSNTVRPTYGLLVHCLSHFNVFRVTTRRFGFCTGMGNMLDGVYLGRKTPLCYTSDHGAYN